MFSKPPPTLHRHPQLNINPITPPKSTHSPPHPPPHHYHSGQQQLPGIYPHHNITSPTTTIHIRVSTSHTRLYYQHHPHTNHPCYLPSTPTNDHPCYHPHQQNNDHPLTLLIHRCTTSIGLKNQSYTLLCTYLLFQPFLF